MKIKNQKEMILIKDLNHYQIQREIVLNPKRKEYLNLFKTASNEKKRIRITDPINLEESKSPSNNQDHINIIKVENTEISMAQNINILPKIINNPSVQNSKNNTLI